MFYKLKLVVVIYFMLDTRLNTIIPCICNVLPLFNIFWIFQIVKFNDEYENIFTSNNMEIFEIFHFISFMRKDCVALS